jgi:hypothetical protein
MLLQLIETHEHAGEFNSVSAMVFALLAKEKPPRINMAASRP